MIHINGYLYNYKLSQPLTISFHTWHYQENVIIELEYKGVTGLGEAAPFKPITGDSQEEVINELQTLSPLLLNPETDGIDVLDTYLESISCPTLKAAIDFAYHDLIAKMKNIPVYALYTNTPTLVDNSVTIFIKPTIKETIEETKRIVSAYPTLNILKIKLKGEDDIARVQAIKKVMPTHMKFLVDANQGFIDEKKAVETLTEIQHVLENIILVEEPCPRGELQKLKYVKDHVSDMLIFADESAATYKDAVKVIKAHAADGINIKLQKAGGISQGKKIASLCKDHHLKIMVGSMLDGPIATAASTHFAVSTENVILSDLDMDLDTQKHTKGQIDFTDGKRIPNNQAGLGIKLDMSAIHSLQKTRKLIYKKIVG